MADLKKLFTLSHNECAFSSCEQRLAEDRWPEVMAEIAHIYGLNPRSSRHDPLMSIEECNSYENLMLFCPNHHHLIDDLEAEEYSADKLLDMKRTHEKGRRQQWYADPVAVVTAVHKLAITLNIVLLPEAATPSKAPSRPAPEPRSRPKHLRMHELARELGMTNAEIMELSDAMGVGAKSHASTIIEQQADRLRRRAERDGLTRPEQPPETREHRRRPARAASAGPTHSRDQPF